MVAIGSVAALKQEQEVGMHKKVREMMNSHENDNPHHRELNDLAIEDLKSLGEISPAKPFALHVGYTLDGHHKNRGRYNKNYDHGISPEDKKLIDKEVFDISELGAMLHDPEYIADDSHDMPTDNHKMAMEVLAHYMIKHGPHESHGHLMEELYRPLMNALMDRTIDEESILHALLSPEMVKESEHSKEDYSDILKAFLMWPAIDGHRKGHWKNKLPKIFEAMGGKNA